jgi:hypothetical protein
VACSSITTKREPNFRLFVPTIEKLTFSPRVEQALPKTNSLTTMMDKEKKKTKKKEQKSCVHWFKSGTSYQWQ